MICLFIGGAANGHRINVRDSATFWRVSSGRFGTEYRREQLAGSSQRYAIFVENHLTLDAAMQALIDGYNPHASTHESAIGSTTNQTG